MWCWYDIECWCISSRASRQRCSGPSSRLQSPRPTLPAPPRPWEQAWPGGRRHPQLSHPCSRLHCCRQGRQVEPRSLASLSLHSRLARLQPPPSSFPEEANSNRVLPLSSSPPHRWSRAVRLPSPASNSKAAALGKKSKRFLLNNNRKWLASLKIFLLQYVFYCMLSFISYKKKYRKYPRIAHIKNPINILICIDSGSDR